MIMITFTGLRRYAFNKVEHYRRLGYTIVRQREWSDGSFTFTMEKVK